MGVEIRIQNVPEGITYWSVGIADVETGYNGVFDWLTTVPVDEPAICEQTLSQYSYLNLVRIWEDISGYPEAERAFGFADEMFLEDGGKYVYNWETAELSIGTGTAGTIWAWILSGGLIAVGVGLIKRVRK